MRMLVLIILLISLLILPDYVNDPKITLKFMDYIIVSDIKHVLLLIIIIFILYQIITNPIKKLISLWKTARHDNIFLVCINHNLRYDLATINPIIKTHCNVKLIKKFNRVIVHTKNQKYNNALDELSAIAYNKKTEEIILKYKIHVLYQQGNYNDAILQCKNGILSGTDNYWFINKLFVIATEHNYQNEYEYLNNISTKIKTNHGKLFCDIRFRHLKDLSKTATNDVIKELKALVKFYPNYFAFYQLLFQLIPNTHSYDEIKTYLLNMWYHHHDYQAIKLWSVLPIKAKDDIDQLVQSLEEVNKTDPRANNLLLAFLYININQFIEAHNIIKSDVIYDEVYYMLTLILFEKEHRNKVLDSVIQYLGENKISQPN